MQEPVSLIKENPLLPAEDYVSLRKKGFKYIEKLGSDIWTDYNNSDPGITILEAVCYAITDLAYRTGFEMKDLLSPKVLTDDTWKQIFYTARQILHNSPLTINDYRRLFIDIKGVRNAWVEKSKDYEVPVWIDYNYPDKRKDHHCSCDSKEEKICYGKLGLAPIDIATYRQGFQDKRNTLKTTLDGLPVNATPEEKTALQVQIVKLDWQLSQITNIQANLLPGKIVEFEGLYTVMVEYEEDVPEEKHGSVRQLIVERLARNRNLCEDFLSVDEVDYEDFGIGLFAALEEYADPDKVLAQIFFIIYKYFTPSIPFHTIQQMLDKGYLVDEIFEGPPLKHGFIDTTELENTDLFRDIRLSDIINEISDIKGIKAITYLHLPFEGLNDATSNKDFFNLWIKYLQDQRKVARIKPAMSQVMFCKERDVITYYMGRKEDRRPDRMLKLFKDLKTLEGKYKLEGQQIDFPVPTGEYMDLEDYYPVTYSLPMCYGVSERAGLPSEAEEKQKAQALQLKGYMQFFEQILSGYLVQLNHLKDLFTFDDTIKRTSFTRELYSATEYNETQLSEIQDLKTLLIDHENRGADHWDAILKDFTGVLQNLLEPPNLFNKRRNRIVNHMLARFSEDMSEYEAISRWLTPHNVDERLIRDKIRLLKDGEYHKISTQRGKGYDYTQSDVRDTSNVSGAERRVERLLGFADVTRRTLATEYVVVEPIVEILKKDKKNIIKLLDPDKKEAILLTSVEVKEGCCTESLITEILSHADDRRNFTFLNGTKQRRWKQDESAGPFWFDLYDSYVPNDDAVLLASSASFETEKERENAFDKLKKLMDKINGNEGLHLVEHLLLRPKFDEVHDEEGMLVNAAFLNICLDACDLGIGLNKDPETPLYRKKITTVPAAKCFDKMPWILEYFEYKEADPSALKYPKSILFQQAFADGSEPVNLKFRKYDLLTKRVQDLQEFGSEIVNYEIVSNLEERNDPANIKYSFIIHGEKRVNLAQSDFIFSRRTKKQIEDKVEGDLDDIDDEIDRLMHYFGFEMDLYCEEDPCDNNEDPYSFRTTVILPCWPKRFRDPTFRNLVEKTIQTEFPAHIHTHVVWVGLQEMQQFEVVYYNWLREMAQNEMPGYEVVNPLVEKLNTLKPCGACDDECGD